MRPKRMDKTACRREEASQLEEMRCRHSGHVLRSLEVRGKIV
jgi:hypothetical protein